MPTGPEALLTHLTRLEQELGELRSQVIRGVTRDSHVGDRRNPRLAITCKSPSGDPYPEIDDEPDTYWIRFLDTSFPRVQGKQGNTKRERQTAGNEFTLAQNTMGGTRDAYVPEGSVIEVTADRTQTGTMQWWFTRIDPEQDDSSGDLTIDVLICEPWNRCTEYIVFPQRRIHLPPGSSITTLPNSVVPLAICESSQPPPSNGDPPSDSVGDSSSGGLGTPWTDDDIFWDYLVVTGLITPVSALGGYSCGAGYYNGRPFWFKYSEDGSWMIYWNPAAGGCWMIRHIGDAVNFWYKYDDPNTPTGDYNPSPFATGVAEVAVGGPP